MHTTGVILADYEKSDSNLRLQIAKKTFEGLRTQIIYPYARGLRVLGEDAASSLKALNQAGSDSAIDEITNNTWIGEGMLAWLLCNGLDGRGDIKTSTPGPMDDGATFSVWVDDRISLQGGGEGGPQKVVVSGSQDLYAEARSALINSKTINSAVVYVEHGENQWKFRLDSEKFMFGSFRCPSVHIEQQGADELSEKESAFYERMYLLEQGLQMFDSALRAYLLERTDDKKWAQWNDNYQAWLAGQETEAE